MEPALQPTFIPKKTLGPQPVVKPRRTISFFYIVVVVAFITTVVVAGAALGFEYYLKNKLNLKTQTLQTELDKFEPALVADLARTDLKIESAKTFLKNHPALSYSGFFDFIGQITLKSVRFTDFAFSVKDDKFHVSMGGQAKDFASVALQAEEFAKPTNQRYLKNLAISDLSLGDKGDAIFNVSADLNSELVLYSEILKRESIVVSSTTSQ